MLSVICAEREPSKRERQCHENLTRSEEIVLHKLRRFAPLQHILPRKRIQLIQISNWMKTYYFLPWFVFKWSRSLFGSQRHIKERMKTHKGDLAILHNTEEIWSMSKKHCDSLQPGWDHIEGCWGIPLYFPIGCKPDFIFFDREL